MNRILLADDSPHAKRMGERILREEGFEVVTVTDGHTALLRLPDVDPDVVLADVSLPGRSGYEICREIKQHPQLSHIRVVLTAGLLEVFDEAEAAAAGCDAVLKKPFEPTAMLDVVRPLVREAGQTRPAELQPLSPALFVVPSPSRPSGSDENSHHADPHHADPEAERVRAAVTLALDAALPSLIEEITQKLLLALRH
ncbi:MAG: response regulator [Bryobacteraceae bacterium]|nr:response regulator [Bryobacteraceae bacterium]